VKFTALIQGVKREERYGMAIHILEKEQHMIKLTLTVIVMSTFSAGAADNFAGWHNSDKWDVAGDATLHPDSIRRLVGKAGDGVLINGKEGKRPSLVTKRRDYRDVEVHLEFMVAKGSNSGVIFHGNYEIQILRGDISWQL